mmetsp:Transcript_25431/g.70859  ORF Transcript_25431/g.70859 Transcript_25431/m.70859 type:complete len:267 (-) Transcript_25431:326-1126(-)
MHHKSVRRCLQSARRSFHSVLEGVVVVSEAHDGGCLRAAERFHSRPEPHHRRGGHVEFRGLWVPVYATRDEAELDRVHAWKLTIHRRDEVVLADSVHGVCSHVLDSLQEVLAARNGWAMTTRSTLALGPHYVKHGNVPFVQWPGWSIEHIQEGRPDSAAPRHTGEGTKKPKLARSSRRNFSFGRLDILQALQHTRRCLRSFEHRLVQDLVRVLPIWQAQRPGEGKVDGPTPNVQEVVPGIDGGRVGRRGSLVDGSVLFGLTTKPEA